ncbi:MAG: efflux RND transporter periplasmic adaptor subunit [Phycisphaeraceae bacterium]
MLFNVAKIVGMVLVLVLVGGITWAVWQKTNAEDEGIGGGDSDAPVAVQVQPVVVGEISNMRTFTGTLEPQSAFTIAPRVSGRLERLHADIGDIVERGQLVAELDEAERVQDVEQAEAELAVARANLDEVRSGLSTSEREYERFRTLREQQIASESEMDAAKAEFEAKQAQLQVAQSQVTQQEAALQAARVRESYTRLHATWNGGAERRVVGERYRDQGDMLAANTPVVSLLDIDTLRAVIHVAERDYPNVQVGQVASVMADAYHGREFEAEVTRVAPEFQRGSRQARVELRVPNAEHLLKPGMFARVRLEVGRAEEAVLVPLTAIVQRQGNAGVFVVDEEQSQVRFVPVQLGFQHGKQVQVLEPMLEGRVVTLGQHLLADASKIRIDEQAEAADETPEETAAEAEAATLGTAEER